MASTFTPEATSPEALSPDGKEVSYRWFDERDFPQTIDRLSAFAGNAGVLLRAYAYIRMLGRADLARVAKFATLNANYMMARRGQEGFDLLIESVARHTSLSSRSNAKRRRKVSRRQTMLSAF